MDIFDLIGPIMVGPSSSHTAGAVRIGLACRRILGEEIAEADITLSGSFAATGRGHGTDKAIIGGLLGISQSYISRLEKKIIERLRRELQRQMQV